MFSGIEDNADFETDALLSQLLFPFVSMAASENNDYKMGKLLETLQAQNSMDSFPLCDSFQKNHIGSELKSHA